MENGDIKCSLENHSNKAAKVFCQDCKILMCEECNEKHLGICKLHNYHQLDKISNDKCKNAKHISEINFFCKSHNRLCNTKCNIYPKNNIYGQESICEIFLLNNIEEEQRNKLKENVKQLEYELKYIDDITKKLKKLTDTIFDKKEGIKIVIQKIFTKIRNAVNDKEEELFAEVDEYFNDLFFQKEIVKEGEKLPKKIKASLEKAKLIDNQWNNNKLNSLITDCLNIENTIKEIDKIKNDINFFDDGKIDVKFYPEENEIQYFLEKIKKFGKVSYNNYSFRQCPININQDKRYSISGENQNIFTKTGTDSCWTGIICEKRLDMDKDEHKWKIKILKTYNYNIMVGVATIDFDANSSDYSIKNNGWYYNCINGTLYSGDPHNYQGKYINLKIKNDEIIIVMNMKKRTLKFRNNKEDKEDSYLDIPLDKPIFPSILLRDIFDSVEIEKM